MPFGEQPPLIRPSHLRPGRGCIARDVAREQVHVGHQLRAVLHPVPGRLLAGVPTFSGLAPKSHSFNFVLFVLFFDPFAPFQGMNGWGTCLNAPLCGVGVKKKKKKKPGKHVPHTPLPRLIAGGRRLGEGQPPKKKGDILPLKCW